MKHILKYDFGILGGGLGGLGVASLLTQNSSSIALVESHYQLGGCAGWYGRKGFTFDVGATTLSAVETNQPLGKFAQRLAIPFEFTKIDPGIIYHLDGEPIERFSDPKKWQESLRKINSNSATIFWERIKRVHDFAWQAADKLIPFPPTNKTDFLQKLIKLGTELKLKDVAYFFLPLSEWPGFTSTNESERKIINETLLISCQGKIHEIPGVFAAMGLEYPAHTYYHKGGMKGFVEKFSDYLKSKKVKTIMRNPIVRIEKQGKGYLLVGRKESLWVKNLITNIPLDNCYELFSGQEEKNYFDKTRKKFSAEYSALTAYIGLEYQESLPGLYFQIHLKEKPDFISSDSLFLSFSQQNDLERAPEGMRTLSVSTHTKVKAWQALSKGEYQQRKEIFKNLVLKILKTEMVNYKLGAVKEIQVGTPSTFEDYTGRAYGLVGGYPASYQNNPLKKPFNKTPFENLFLVGDTVFPAQGSPGVLLGALNAFEQVNRLAL